MITASAPGKLVLSGEYAVLTGAPAVVLAVGVRAEVSIREADACSVRCAGPSAAPARFGYRVDGGIDWADGRADDYALLSAVLATIAEAGPLPGGRDFAAVLDTAAFYDGSKKLGLGSSAALTVALAAALGRHFGRTPDPALAYRAHRRLQGGGSGLDVAAAIAGGLLLFTPAAGGLPQLGALAWPADLHARFLWSGEPAATGPRVRRFRDWSDGASAGPLVSRLADEARAAASAWSSGDAARIVAATSGYGHALRELEASAGIDVYGGGHERLSRLADAAGVVYKPSGAGGGDLGVALSTDARHLHDFLAHAGRAGYRALDLVREPAGLVIGP